MNECEKYEALISSLIDSEISEEDKSALAKHLESCPDCRAMYESFKAVSDFMADNLEDIPEGLHENIMAQVRREDIKKKNKRGLPKSLKTLIAAAACAAVIVGVGYGVMPVIRPAGSGEVFSVSPRSGDAENGAVMEASLPQSAEAPEAAAPDPSEAAVLSLPDSEEAAEADGIDNTHRDLVRGEVFSGKDAPQLSMSSPLSSPLSLELFDALLDMTGRSIFDAEAEAVRAADAVLVLSCEDGRSVNFYDYNSNLCYIVSSSESVYTANCEYEDILDFLNENT